MNQRTTATVLLVGDDPADAKQIQDALECTGERPFHVEWVRRLVTALARLEQAPADLVLLDLKLPDGEGLAAIDRVVQVAPDALILILSDANEDDIAREGVARGAHDYLAKGHGDTHWLPLALRYMIECKSARDALRGSEAKFRAMSDASPLGIFVSDSQGQCVYTNAAYHKISGLDFEQALGTNWSMAVHPDDRVRVLAEWHAAALNEEPFQSEVRFLQEGERVVWARLNAAVMVDGKSSRGRVQTVEDITERIAFEHSLRTAEEALFAEKERAQVTLNSIGDAVLCTDLLGRVTYMNLVAETMTGWVLDEARGRPFSEVFSIINASTRLPAENPVKRAIDGNKTIALAANCVLLRRDGSESAIEDSASPIHGRDGEASGAVIVFHDVSESRAMALKMAHLAQHDFLTGLPNRLLLTERLSQAIGQAHRRHKLVGLMFLDMDHFKHINDSLGHTIGDQLLQSVATRLATCVRTTDTICRQGGDEFVILLAEIDQPQAAANVAEKIIAAFAAPHPIGSQELHVSLSIGISTYPDDGTSLETMMQNADTAMYHAKASGRNNYQFFKADMNARAVLRLFVESNLRRALKHGEFVLHYQPKINLDSGAMTGAEALIRWIDPGLGLIYPGQFVPIAEECGLIVPIGRWVLREVCRQVHAWLDTGLQAVPVSVNISAVEFRQKDFLESVAAILKETGMPPHYLELELTESVLMHEAETSAAVLEALKLMGVRLAIDDFGTGYSSLSYLQRFPIDTLKIDQSFVRDIATGDDGSIIVGAVIDMGRNLKKLVVAEGVETQEQLAFLRARHCDEGQGFQFSRPLPVDTFVDLLAR